MNTFNTESFKCNLEVLQEFPCDFPFKFIVPIAQLDKVKALFPNEILSIRESKGGKYVSVSADVPVESADVVIAVFEKASMIKGIISL